MFDRVGGEEFFETLTRRFCEGVSGDPVLRPLYPDDPEAFDASRLHLKLFLVQFWGGPQVYREERGEPRLRMRHAPFSIGKEQRDAWMTHMEAAVREAGLSPLDEAQMLGYLSAAATQMINDGSRA
jgi:hemoglobin